MTDDARAIADLIGLDPDVAVAVSAIQDELLPLVYRYRAAWQSARRRAAGLESDMRHYEETVIGDLNERNTRDCRRADTAEAAIERVRAVHRVSTMHDAVPGRAPYCVNCRFQWPCPTIQALERQ